MGRIGVERQWASIGGAGCGGAGAAGRGAPGGRPGWGEARPHVIPFEAHPSLASPNVPLSRASPNVTVSPIKRGKLVASWRNAVELWRIVANRARPRPPVYSPTRHCWQPCTTNSPLPTDPRERSQRPPPLCLELRPARRLRRADTVLKLIETCSAAVHDSGT